METVRMTKTELETSAYYKGRLYQYTNKYGTVETYDCQVDDNDTARFAVRLREEDGYIQT
jgi:hypothetical protein